MVETPSSRMNPARKRFVQRLLVAKRALSPSGTTGGAGPNKALAEKMQVSPRRVAEFLSGDFALFEKNGADGGPPTSSHIKKTVMGFAESVERALQWLATQNLHEQLETKSLIRGYWPTGDIPPFNSAAIQQAIQQGAESARNKLVKLKKIKVTLKSIPWGPRTNRPAEDRFLVRYGRAIFREIDALDTITSVDDAEYESRFDLNPRAGHGDWEVSLGTYETLERRFRGFEFVTFPALKYPLLGLIASHEHLPTHIDFDFVPVQALSRQSLFDTEIIRDIYTRAPIPRLVADEVGKATLYSMFGTEGEAERCLVESVPRIDANEVVKAIRRKLDENAPAVAFIGDGWLTFRVLSLLTGAGLRTSILGARKAAFSFSGGIMFRQEDHSLQQLLEDAQRRLFRMPSRVTGLLIAFLRELDDWVDGLNPVERQALDSLDKPLFLYPHHEVAAYLSSCSIPGDHAWLATDIFDQAMSALSIPVDPSSVHERLAFKHASEVTKLFQPTDDQPGKPPMTQEG